jgi:hypothetical protein
VPAPLPHEEPSSTAPRRIRVTAEIVVRVTDETALREAAAERVDEGEHASEADRERERALVQTDNASAVALLADPAAVADSIPGVEVVELTWSAGFSETPDFAALFPAGDVAGAREQDEGWQLTPRTAGVLYHALSVLADDAYDDVEQHGDDPVTDDGEWNLFDRLPRVSWRQDTHWRRQAARAFDDLSADLAHGLRPEPHCNAEELALHLAIADAPEVLKMTELIEPELRGLPEHMDDYDWEMCSEVLFQDHDILMLDDAAMDGLEDPDSAVNREFGIGDLRPSNWFRPFDNAEQRDPRRGFRR